MSTPATNRPDNTTPSVSEGGLKIWSCVICRRRKVRCDRRDPCANCVKNAIECHYPVTGRIPRRNRDPAAWKSPAQKQSELLSRLRRLETVVTELAGQVEDGSANRWATPSSSGNGSSANAEEVTAASFGSSRASSSNAAQTVNSSGGSEFDEDFGRLVIDKDGGLHVGNRFWSVFCSEVDNILQAVHDVTEFDGEEGISAALEPGLAGHSTAQSFVFGHRASNDDLSPLPSQMLFIWQTYVDNVDPFIKILHDQEIEKVVRGLKGKLSSLSPNFEALLFAISMAAIASMDEEDTSLNFGSKKNELLERFRCGTEQALVKADFMISKDIVVVQALVIHVSMLPHIGADQLSWPLTGLLLRIAKSNGLHIDGANGSIGEVDAEIRRRLWWQICFIDSRCRAPGMQDLSLSSSSFTTGLPSPRLPEHSSTPGLFTSETTPMDMTLCLIRCEIWQLVQALFAHRSSTLQIRQDVFQETKRRIESNYLSSLRGDPSYREFVKTMTSLFLAKVELVISHRSKHCDGFAPDPYSSPQGRQSNSTLLLALTIIEAVHRLRTETSWKKWRWQLQGQIPWHAMAIFLRHACRQPWSTAFEGAWEFTSSLMEMASEEVKGGRLWESLDKLMAHTRIHREQELGRITTGPDNTVHPNITVVNDSTQTTTAAEVPQPAFRGNMDFQSSNFVSMPTNSLMPEVSVGTTQDSAQTWDGIDPGVDFRNWDQVNGMDIVWEMLDF